MGRRAGRGPEPWRFWGGGHFFGMSLMGQGAHTYGKFPMGGHFLAPPVECICATIFPQYQPVQPNFEKRRFPIRIRI